MTRAFERPTEESRWRRFLRGVCTFIEACAEEVVARVDDAIGELGELGDAVVFDSDGGGDAGDSD
jgi:hypothetical protein